MEYSEKRKFSGNQDGYHQSKRAHAQARSPAAMNGATLAEGDVHASMDIPSHKVNQVIGKKGTAVQAVMDQSGCKIRVDPDISQNPRRVYITGQPDGISKAMILIQKILAEGPAFLVPLSEIDLPKLEGDMVTDDQDVFVAHAKVSTLIGAKGVIVGEIMKRTGCKVHVIQDGVPDNQDRAVSFTGTPAQIEEAKALVRQVIQDGPAALGPQTGSPAGSGGAGASTTSQGNLQVEERDISPSRVGIVIGSKGTIVRDIMAKSGGCRVYVNQNFPEGQPHKIVYTGTAEQIKLAMHYVDLVCERGPQALEHIASPSSNPSQDLVFYQSQINRLIGPQGAILHGIQSQHMVNITFEPVLSTIGFPDPQSRVVIRGHPEGVKAATRTIYAFLGIPDPSVPVYMYDGAYGGYGGQSGNSSLSAGFALGPDGSSGFLDTPVHMMDGMTHQMAEIKEPQSYKVIGKNHHTLFLIGKKSGAKLVMARQGQDISKPARQGYVRVHIFGSGSSVSYAAQMIQEILVNGVNKVHQMPDVPPTTPMNYNGFAHLPPYMYPSGHYNHGHGHGHGYQYHGNGNGGHHGERRSNSSNSNNNNNSRDNSGSSGHQR